MYDKSSCARVQNRLFLLRLISSEAGHIMLYESVKLSVLCSRYPSQQQNLPLILLLDYTHR